MPRKHRKRSGKSKKKLPKKSRGKLQRNKTNPTESKHSLMLASNFYSASAARYCFSINMATEKQSQIKSFDIEELFQGFIRRPYAFLVTGEIGSVKTLEDNYAVSYETQLFLKSAHQQLTHILPQNLCDEKPNANSTLKKLVLMTLTGRIAYVICRRAKSLIYFIDKKCHNPKAIKKFTMQYELLQPIDQLFEYCTWLYKSALSELLASVDISMLSTSSSYKVVLNLIVQELVFSMHEINKLKMVVELLTIEAACDYSLPKQTDYYKHVNYNRVMRQKNFQLLEKDGHYYPFMYIASHVNYVKSCELAIDIAQSIISRNDNIKIKIPKINASLLKDTKTNLSFLNSKDKYETKDYKLAPDPIILAHRFQQQFKLIKEIPANVSLLTSEDSNERLCQDDSHDVQYAFQTLINIFNDGRHRQDAKDSTVLLKRIDTIEVLHKNLKPPISGVLIHLLSEEVTSVLGSLQEDLKVLNNYEELDAELSSIEMKQSEKKAAEDSKERKKIIEDNKKAFTRYEADVLQKRKISLAEIKASHEKAKLALSTDLIEKIIPGKGSEKHKQFFYQMQVFKNICAKRGNLQNNHIQLFYRSLILYFEREKIIKPGTLEQYLPFISTICSAERKFEETLDNPPKDINGVLMNNTVVLTYQQQSYAPKALLSVFFLTCQMAYQISKLWQYIDKELPDFDVLLSEFKKSSGLLLAQHQNFQNKNNTICLYLISFIKNKIMYLTKSTNVRFKIIKNKIRAIEIYRQKKQYAIDMATARSRQLQSNVQLPQHILDKHKREKEKRKKAYREKDAEHNEYMSRIRATYPKDYFQEKKFEITLSTVIRQLSQSRMRIALGPTKPKGTIVAMYHQITDHQQTYCMHEFIVEMRALQERKICNTDILILLRKFYDHKLETHPDARKYIEQLVASLKPTNSDVLNDLTVLNKGNDNIVIAIEDVLKHFTESNDEEINKLRRTDCHIMGSAAMHLLGLCDNKPTDIDVFFIEGPYFDVVQSYSTQKFQVLLETKASRDALTAAAPEKYHDKGQYKFIYHKGVLQWLKVTLATESKQTYDITIVADGLSEPAYTCCRFSYNCITKQFEILPSNDAQFHLTVNQLVHMHAIENPMFCDMSNTDARFRDKQRQFLLKLGFTEPELSYQRSNRLLIS